MKILRSLSIDEQNSLQITANVDEGEIINLYDTRLHFYLQNQQGLLCLRKANVGYDLYYLVEHVQQCIDGQKAIPLKFSINADLGILYHEHTQSIILAEEEGNLLKTWAWQGTS